MRGHTRVQRLPKGRFNAELKRAVGVNQSGGRKGERVYELEQTACSEK